MKNLPVVTEFTVERGKWGRYVLMGRTGNMCALGFYAKACGYTNKELFDGLYGHMAGIAETKASFLPMIDLENREDCSPLAKKIYTANDLAERDEDEITSLFASIGVTVNFTG